MIDQGEGPGLSKGHICANGGNLPENRLEYFAGAGLVRAVTPYRGEPVQHEERSVRGTIKGYTAASSRRCRQKLAMIEDAAILAGFLVTLTYPGTQCADKIPTPEEFETYKKQLHRFGDALERDWGAGMFWTQEFQKRDAVHFHGIIFGVDHGRFCEFKEWTAKTWNRIVDGGSDHLTAGTRVEFPKSAGGARGYLTQYMSKKDQRRDGIECGRYWGVMNRKRVPFAPCMIVELTEAEGIKVKRVSRKYVMSKRKACTWAILWLRARDKMAEHFGCNLLDRSSIQEFRKLVEDADRHGRLDPAWIPAIQKGLCSIPLPRVAFLGGVMLAMGGTWKLPRKPRDRNNSTVNVYGVANHIAGDLIRYVELTRVENEQERRLVRDVPEDDGRRLGESAGGRRVRSYVLAASPRMMGDPF